MMWSKNIRSIQICLHRRLTGEHVTVNGRRWTKTGSALEEEVIIYIGSEGPTLTNLMMALNKNSFISYNPDTRSARAESINVNKALMKRFYMVEKAKDANIVVLVVGTLGVANYLEMHDRLRSLITKSGKKCYSIVVGKLNPAKLANFMEADIFVLIACQENSLIDSSEFYKPVITPLEMELACNTDREWTGDYVTDFRALLPFGSHYVSIPDEIAPSTDVSLVTGGMRQMGVSEVTVSADNQVAVRNDLLLVANTSGTAGEYLAQRSWKGLEQSLGETPVEKARQGTTGIAMKYEHEPNT